MKLIKWIFKTVAWLVLFYILYAMFGGLTAFIILFIIVGINEVLKGIKNNKSKNNKRRLP